MRSWITDAPVISAFKLGATERTLVELLASLNRARELIDRLGDSGVATSYTGDIGASSKPITVLRQSDGTRLVVRLSGNRNAEFTLSPRVRLLTPTVEPGREPPAAKTLALVSVFEHHLRTVARGDSIGPDAAALHRKRLEAIGAFLRTGDRLPVMGSEARIHLATPWSPLRVRTTDRSGRELPDLLSDRERRAWTVDPIIAVPILETADTVFTTVGPLHAPAGVRGSTDPMAELRLIATLPPIGRRATP